MSAIEWNVAARAAGKTVHGPDDKTNQVNNHSSVGSYVPFPGAGDVLHSNAMFRVTASSQPQEAKRRKYIEATGCEPRVSALGTSYHSPGEARLLYQP